MSKATVQSRCECQATLFAEVDDQLRVTRGWARRLQNPDETAPANALNPSGNRFDVGWACPICTRNTLRSFDRSYLVWSR